MIKRTHAIIALIVALAGIVGPIVGFGVRGVQWQTGVDNRLDSQDKAIVDTDNAAGALATQRFAEAQRQFAEIKSKQNSIEQTVDALEVEATDGAPERARRLESKLFVVSEDVQSIVQNQQRFRAQHDTLWLAMRELAAVIPDTIVETRVDTVMAPKQKRKRFFFF